MEQTTPTSTNPAPTNPNAGKGMGIAGMVLGIVAIIVSFIPCFGWGAIIIAVIGLILSAVSLSQANKAGAPKGMAIAGLICSVIAIIVGSVWIFIITKAASEINTELQKSGALDSLNKAMQQLKEMTDTMKTQ